MWFSKKKFENLIQSSCRTCFPVNFWHGHFCSRFRYIHFQLALFTVVGFIPTLGIYSTIPGASPCSRQSGSISRFALQAWFHHTIHRAGLWMCTLAIFAFVCGYFLTRIVLHVVLPEMEKLMGSRSVSWLDGGVFLLLGFGRGPLDEIFWLTE